MSTPPVDPMKFLTQLGIPQSQLDLIPKDSDGSKFLFVVRFAPGVNASRQYQRFPDSTMQCCTNLEKKRCWVINAEPDLIYNPTFTQVQRYRSGIHQSVKEGRTIVHVYRKQDSQPPIPLGVPKNSVIDFGISLEFCGPRYLETVLEWAEQQMREAPGSASHHHHDVSRRAELNEKLKSCLGAEGLDKLADAIPSDPHGPQYIFVVRRISDVVKPEHETTEALEARGCTVVVEDAQGRNKSVLENGTTEASNASTVVIEDAQDKNMWALEDMMGNRPELFLGRKSVVMVEVKQAPKPEMTEPVQKVVHVKLPNFTSHDSMDLVLSNLHPAEMRSSTRAFVHQRYSDRRRGGSLNGLLGDGWLDVDGLAVVKGARRVSRFEMFQDSWICIERTLLLGVLLSTSRCLDLLSGSWEPQAEKVFKAGFVLMSERIVDLETGKHEPIPNPLTPGPNLKGEEWWAQEYSQPLLDQGCKVTLQRPVTSAMAEEIRDCHHKDLAAGRKYVLRIFWQGDEAFQPSTPGLNERDYNVYDTILDPEPVLRQPAIERDFLQGLPKWFVDCRRRGVAA
ncbi:hypothetical protein QBC46DRAFT_339418 [Diplogelasinospora grovesii]|uniref:Uncharacterized protein n=1 Tax=Diplogelasinospora grovesii TaxID=303347 RepID=A0AAN6S6Q9_9PEZI|nr:hypothetical protein QBC46DRAFT_339418 [Diplogelasinospora grovesii]